MTFCVKATGYRASEVNANASYRGLTTKCVGTRARRDPCRRQAARSCARTWERRVLIPESRRRRLPMAFLRVRSVSRHPLGPGTRTALRKCVRIAELSTPRDVCRAVGSYAIRRRSRSHHVAMCRRIGGVGRRGAEDAEFPPRHSVEDIAVGRGYGLVVEAGFLDGTGFGSTDSGAKSARFGVLVATPPAGISSFADHAMPFRMKRRNSSSPQFL
jgi:hypothetical protein